MEHTILSKFQSLFTQFLQRLAFGFSWKFRRVDLYTEGEMIHLKFTSPNHSDRTDGINSIDAIILHHTGGAFPGCAIWLSSKQSKVSAHYLITRRGLIYELVPDIKKAWHAGRGAFDLNKDGSISADERQWNNRAIGIELEADGARHYQYTNSQMVMVKALCLHLCKKYDISSDNILGHKEIAPDRKIDPYNFSMPMFRQEIQNMLGEF